MRSYHIDQIGSLDHLACREHEVPVAGPHQVLMRVRANSLNARDYTMIMGEYFLKPRPGLIPLCDGAGEVAAIGPGVTRFKVGDRVAAIFHQGWLSGPRTPEHPRADLGGSLDGMLSEYVLLDEEGLVRIPSNLSFAEAATLPAAGVTAWNALMAHGPLLPGQWVLVQGTGSVAVFAAQFARLAGARVAVLSSSDAKLERMEALGAELLVNHVTHPDWAKEVLRLTARRGVDLVVEVIGDLDKTFRATRIGGQISFVGRLGNKDANVSATPVQLRNLRLIGIGVGSRADFESMVQAIEAHDMHPLILQRFDFDEARAAYEAFGRRSEVGKIVIESHD
jgi:NADPH:quinone reductase-like Zn-dependent oxidoreductase